jgi:sigma-B regulation protein RsbU (phosphoserine phosphatase)
LLVRGDGQIESLNRGGTIIGLGGGVPFDEGEIELHPSDRVFLYTDGVFERENAAEEAFGQDRVAHELYAARGDSLPVACERLTRQLNVFARGAPPTDDITLCGLELQNIMKG